VNPATNAPLRPGEAPRTQQEWQAQRYTALLFGILQGTVDPAQYPSIPSYLFGIQNPTSANYNAQFQPQTGMFDGILQPIIAQEYSASGLNLPSVPQQDPNVIGTNAQTAVAAGNNATSIANTNATNATNKDIQAAHDAATLAAQDKQNAGALAVANVKAATDAENTRAQERIAQADRTSRETIAANQLGESKRQFDITTAEGVREFNTNSLMSLLDKGISLAQKPVDWIGYQYFMNNMGVAMNAINASAAVNLFGAIPPTGPSAAGANTGGPGVLHGDMAMATAAGVTPQFMTVAQATQANPGNPSVPETANHTAASLLPQWQQQAGGPDALEAKVAQGRAAEVAPQIQATNSPVAAQLTQQITQQAAAYPPQLAGPSLPGNGGFGVSATPAGGAQAPSVAPPPPSPSAQPSPFGQPFIGDQANKQVPNGTPQVPGAVTNSIGGPMVANQQTLTPEQWAATQAQAAALPQPGSYSPGGMTGTPIMNTGGPDSYIPPNPLTGPSTAQAPDSVPGQMVNVTTGGNTGGATGIYTGTPTPAVANPATGTSTTTSSSGAQTPQGSDLIRQLATQLGMPYEQLTQLINPALIAGGYSPEQIAQTPVIQGLQNPNGAGFGGVYRTAPVGDSKFGQIQAFGIPLNIRGGQDINAQSFLNTTAANRDMIQGAVEATGQPWQDVQQQMLRSSPVSNYTGGAFGKRIY
jgi:hypothetical protein